MGNWLHLLTQLEIRLEIKDGGIVVRFAYFPAVRLRILDESHQEVPMAVLVHAGKKRTLSIQPVDSRGQPAKVDGIPVWTVAPTGGVSLFPSPDGLSCDVMWVAPLDTQTVTVTADADLGPGITSITGTEQVQTLAPEATAINITIGDEVDASA